MNRMAASALLGSSDALTHRYDVALLDLDGVVYVGPDAVPGAPEALAAARQDGMRLAFVTNNAARTPQAVAEHLTRLGIAAEASEVTTSAQAAAHYLADRLPASAAVLVVGTTGLIEALRERGLRPVTKADDDVAAVVQGYSPDLDWKQLAEGCVAIRRGVPWVATNLDPTVPSPRGPLPGNGSLVAALQHATGVDPAATGKPDPTMHRESVQRSGARRPIVVGDRLDTDIAGGNAVGCSSLLVFSGVTTPGELLSAGPTLRPSYLGRDVSALRTAHPEPAVEDGAVRCGAFRVVVSSTELLLSSSDGDDGSGDAKPEPLDGLRALCVAAWQKDGPPPDRRRAEGAAAEAALREWDLD
jgi:HAD superfamily hydrolase (TIGR01450 family)